VKASAFPASGRFCVLDIETAVADEAVAAVARDHDGGFGRVALHALTAVSTLTFGRDAEGVFADFKLASLETAATDEADLILALDRALRPIHDAGGGLITFNGRAHDLPTLARRASRHWLFDALHLPDWTGRDGVRHLDLMLPDGSDKVRRWPSLADSCAALGLPTGVRRGHSPRTVGDASAKGQVDVVATFLLHHYRASAIDRSPGPLLHGWTALARHLASPRVRAPHLMPFIEHPHVAVAARLAPRHPALVDRRANLAPTA